MAVHSKGAAMFAVFFEAHFIPGAQPHDSALAADLKPLLRHIDGFIAVERFQSLTQPEKILSLSCGAMKRHSTPGMSILHIVPHSGLAIRTFLAIIA